MVWIRAGPDFRNAETRPTGRGQRIPGVDGPTEDKGKVSHAKGLGSFGVPWSGLRPLALATPEANTLPTAPILL